MEEKKRFLISHKMYLFFIAAVLFVSLSIGAVVYTISVGQIDTYFKRLAYNSAENFAEFVDPEFLLKVRDAAATEEFQQIRAAAEENEDETAIIDYLKEQGSWDEYVQTREKLVKYLSHMEDIKYLYLITLGESDSRYDMYIMDDFENELYFSYGYYEERESELYGIDPTSRIEPTISNGDWGWLCSAYAPVYAADGSIVCHVGCDVDMERIMTERHNYLIYVALGTFGVTAIVLALAIFFTNRIFVKPLHTLTEETKKFKPSENASYEEAGVVSLELKNRDEISDIYEVIRTMQMNITDYITNLSKMERDNQQYITNLKRAEDDIRDKEEQLGQISKKVYNDSLTGVGNKAAYFRHSDELTRKIHDGTAEFAILMADLNDLKRINDEYGHRSGDVYINGCCRILSDIFRNSSIYRIGGDEFVVILTGQDYNNRTELFEKARQAYEKSYSDTDAKPYERYSASLGIADYASDDNTVELVFKRADKKMYQDKMRFKEINGSYR